MNRLPLSVACVALLASTTGCVPNLFRRDADRQVQAIIRAEQQRAIDYTPAVDVAVTESATPTKKTYARMPTTALPELLTDVITTRRTDVESDAARRRRTLGPAATVVAAAPSALKQYSAVARVRARLREPTLLGPPAALAKAKRFSLFDSVAYAAENSREYQTQMERLYSTALDVTLQRHLFEPRPFADVRAGVDSRYAQGVGNVPAGQTNDVRYRSAYTVTGEVGVRQQLPYGGEIVASGLVTFVNALTDFTADGETATLALTGSIPLLRGAGMVNLEPLINSERNVVYAVRDFESYRRDFAVGIASSYFRLITQQQAIRNRYVRYVSAIELTNRTEALFDAGLLSALEVQRAQTELLQSEDDVNDALETFENALDRFKLQLGMPVNDDLDIVPVALDVPQPKLDFDLSSSLARQYRLDLQTARDRIDDARRRVQNSINNLLPDLSLDLGADGGNLGGTSASDLERDSIRYNASLRLDLPLDRLEERNQYRQSLINLEAAKRGVLQLEDQVASDIRASVRRVRSSLVSLDLQQQGIDIAEQRLEFANESLLLGKTSDSRNVVEAQTSLLRAQDLFEQARADVQVAILSYLRDTGVLRLDPASGELGLAMERTGGGSATTRRVERD